jgi:hypothetical protein
MVDHGVSSVDPSKYVIREIVRFGSKFSHNPKIIGINII